MTYLQIVNAVLSRLREDVVTSVNGNDDVVVALVKEFVLDAIKTVQDAHTWTALAEEWEFTTSVGNDSITLTDSARSPIMSYIYNGEGVKLQQINKEEFRRRALRSTSNGTPQYYIIDSTDASGNLKLRVWPSPAEADTYYVYGYQRQTPPSSDTDVVLVPSTPVIYLAHAMSVTERGETGGQTAAELMTLAKRYLEDEIAKDATNSDVDNIWYQV